MIYWEILLGNEDVCGTMQRLYDEFGGAGPLASHLGLSILTVRKKLRECKVEMKARGGPHYKLDRDLFPDGWWNMSTEQISRVTGYTMQYARRLRKEKLCQLGQSTKTQKPDSSSDTSQPKSSSTEQEEVS